jgi:hypothetical protein
MERDDLRKYHELLGIDERSPSGRLVLIRALPPYLLAFEPKLNGFSLSSSHPESIHSKGTEEPSRQGRQPSFTPSLCCVYRRTGTDVLRSILGNRRSCFSASVRLIGKVIFHLGVPGTSGFCRVT